MGWISTTTPSETMLQTAVTSRPRPTIHIHSMENVYNIGHSRRDRSRKRKRSLDYSSEDEDALVPYTYPTPPSPVKSWSPNAEDDIEADHKNKRARRALNIEQGMVGMSLNGHSRPANVLPTYVVDPTWRPAPSFGYINAHNISESEHLEIDEDFGFRDDHLGEGDDPEVVMPTVEEAISSSVRISEGTSKNLSRRQSEDNDAKMKAISWYEPEKDRESRSVNRVGGGNNDRTSISLHRTGIVITDLNDSETDEEDGEEAAAEPPSQNSNRESPSSFVVSPAYLQKFKTIPKSPLPPPESESALALVAYRPAPYLLTPTTQSDEVEELAHTKSIDGKDTGDAMDIDYV